MGMMDAYEYDYERIDDIVEELHDRVGSPPHVNLTALLNRGKVGATTCMHVHVHVCMYMYMYACTCMYVIPRPSQLSQHTYMYVRKKREGQAKFCDVVMTYMYSTLLRTCFELPGNLGTCLPTLSTRPLTTFSCSMGRTSCQEVQNTRPKLASSPSPAPPGFSMFQASVLCVIITSEKLTRPSRFSNVR